MVPQTLAELFLVTAEHDKPDCLLHKVGARYVPISTAELVDRVRRLTAVFLRDGIRPGDRVALMAENGPHWPTIDFAALCSGAVLTPVYPTLSGEDAAYVINDCDARMLFVQGQDRLQQLLEVRDQWPGVETIVLIDSGTQSEDVLSFTKMLADQEPLDPGNFERRAQSVNPNDLATFIYTSGTTGKPKGVMLTHGNIASNVAAVAHLLEMDSAWTALSFLPLSHSFERTVDYIYFYLGISVAYAESVHTVAENLGEVRPHFFVSVPRIYEKVLARVQENVAHSSAVKQKIFHWAQGVARQALPWRLRREQPPGWQGLKLKLADKLVFSKLKHRLGGRFRMAASGGAPLAKDVAEFFWGAGIEIYEGYGLSETSPVLSVNTPRNVKLGTVGPAIDGVQIQFAPDGEILAKGPNVMQGYHNLPEASREAFDDEGWFHTGDIGEIDDDGFIRITDRKKELIVNAYGKNVAPAPIENSLKSSRFIEQAVVIGDRRKFLSALLVPDFETLQAWAQEHGIQANGEALTSNSQVRQLYGGEVNDVNARLSHPQQIRAWDLLSEPLTIESGELTPTLKVKRRVIHERYANCIDRMYNQARA
jgi:long-chain acyl-CoA synthetase